MSRLLLPLALQLAVLFVAAPCVSRAQYLFPADDSWAPVRAVIDDAIKGETAPGMVAVVGNAQGVIFKYAAGHYTYGTLPPYFPTIAGWDTHTTGSPPMKEDTLFDLASLSKIFASTTAVAWLYERGLLDLHEKVSSPRLLGPNFAVNSKADITVLNCMLHNAGFHPDPVPEFWSPQYACPQTGRKPRPELSFDCRNRIYSSTLNQTLLYPTGTRYVYSDLSMITIMFVVGKVVQDNGLVSPAALRSDCVAASGQGVYQCYFEAFLRTHIYQPLGMARTGFLPPASEYGNCAPAENGTSYLPFCIQGEVSDGNAFALGGISGHAGLFSNALDLSKLMHLWMFPEQSGGRFINQTTKDLFTREYNGSFSSRAIGWNTNDPRVFDQGWDLACGPSFSPRTFMHLGYTGTMACGDSDNQVYTLLLTNRVYPTDDSSVKIQNARRAFGNAVHAVLQSARAPVTSGAPALQSAAAGFPSTAERNVRTARKLVRVAVTCGSIVCMVWVLGYLSLQWFRPKRTILGMFKNDSMDETGPSPANVHPLVRPATDSRADRAAWWKDPVLLSALRQLLRTMLFTYAAGAAFLVSVLLAVVATGAISDASHPGGGGAVTAIPAANHVTQSVLMPVGLSPANSMVSAAGLTVDVTAVGQYALGLAFLSDNSKEDTYLTNQRNLCVALICIFTIVVVLYFLLAMGRVAYALCRRNDSAMDAVESESVNHGGLFHTPAGHSTAYTNYPYMTTGGQAFAQSPSGQPLDPHDHHHHPSSQFQQATVVVSPARVSVSGGVSERSPIVSDSVSSSRPIAITNPRAHGGQGQRVYGGGVSHSVPNTQQRLPPVHPSSGLHPEHHIHDPQQPQGSPGYVQGGVSPGSTHPHMAEVSHVSSRGMMDTSGGSVGAVPNASDHHDYLVELLDESGVTVPPPPPRPPHPAPGYTGGDVYSQLQGGDEVVGGYVDEGDWGEQWTEEEKQSYQQISAKDLCRKGIFSHTCYQALASTTVILLMCVSVGCVFENFD